jgi:hypothetical protein
MVVEMAIANYWIIIVWCFAGIFYNVGLGNKK